MVQLAWRENITQQGQQDMNFTISGLSPAPFQHLYGLSDEELIKYNAKRYVCDASPGFPDRIEMRDAKIGEALLLVNHTSMDKDTPYKASHAIFIIEGATQAFRTQNQIPPVMYNRLLSLRAFDQTGMMLDADVAKGDDIERVIERLFGDENVVHIDAHNAAQGCFSGRVLRG